MAIRTSLMQAMLMIGKNRRRHRWLLCSLVLLPLVGCGAPEPQGIDAALAARTPTAVPSRTPAATPLPTPSATAPAAVVSGDPRAPYTSEPVRQAGAPCGFVDTLDFPLDPPDGESASGGGDFGRFRERYDGYHAGEDWRVGRGSLGQPVYSIGHGKVTYAQPLGWGADQGVVIIEHTMRGGRRVLSFYGHLDPPSVSLRAGGCVQRGDQVGRVGDPRTRPHLHFEIRVHLPDTPGPGYWPSDPRRAGWRPPSATIWYERMAASPGVYWSRLHDNAVLASLGVVDDIVLVGSSGEDLLGLDVDDGSLRWSRPWSASARSLLLDPQSRLLYVASAAGVLDAYSTAALARGEAGTPAWSFDLGEGGMPELFPLPGGGLIVSMPSAMLALSVRGEPLWSSEPARGIVDWVISGTELVALAPGRVWTIRRDQATSWPVPMNGRRIVASEQPFSYAEDGLYRLDLQSQSAAIVYSLPSGLPASGDLTELPGGGHLVAHVDPADSRLIAIEADGTLRWERSLKGLGPRSISLLTVDGRCYAVMHFARGNYVGGEVFHVDLADGGLARIFSGGTRFSAVSPLAAYVLGDRMLLSVAGTGLFAVDPESALKSVLSP